MFYGIMFSLIVLLSYTHGYMSCRDSISKKANMLYDEAVRGEHKKYGYWLEAEHVLFDVKRVLGLSEKRE